MIDETDLSETEKAAVRQVFGRCVSKLQREIEMSLWPITYQRINEEWENRKREDAK